MVQVFKSRTTTFQITVFVLVVVVCILVLLLDAAHNWSCLALLTPVILWTDRFLTRIEVYENGDVWIRRGFTGTTKLHGILQLKYDSKKWKSQQILLHHTKGYCTVDPMDRKDFIAYMQKVNPMMEYIEK